MLLQFIVLLILACFIMTLRAFLVVVGMYKDPVLASFENYGEEKIFSPLYSLVVWSSIFLYIFLLFYFDTAVIVVVGLVATIPITAFRREFDSLLTRHHVAFRIFPRWYFELTKRTNREERRRIAYLWLRLPFKTRLLYNARSEYFHQWVDLVLLSIT